MKNWILVQITVIMCGNMPMTNDIDAMLGLGPSHSLNCPRHLCGWNHMGLRVDHVYLSSFSQQFWCRNKYPGNLVDAGIGVGWSVLIHEAQMVLRRNLNPGRKTSRFLKIYFYKLQGGCPTVGQSFDTGMRMFGNYLEVLLPKKLFWENHMFQRQSTETSPKVKYRRWRVKTSNTV